MGQIKRFQQYLVLGGSAELNDVYKKDEQAVEGYLRRKLKAPGLPLPVFSVVGLPSLERLKTYPADYRGEIVIGLKFKDATEIKLFKNRVTMLSPTAGVGADPVIEAAEAWCPVPWSPRFKDSRAASRLIGVDRLRKAGATGSGVNVALVDQGVDMQTLGNNYADGWPQPGKVPGMTKGGHGMMVARNVLRVARDAMIWDCPVLPDRITNIPTFLSQAHDAYLAMLKTFEIEKGAWVFVNAWAVFDHKSDCPPPNDYVNNPKHPFCQLVSYLAKVKGIDIVFAAGNCGEACPDPRCGRRDCGPGKSILGANALQEILTVGAVLCDRTWIGSSSQGPAPSKFHWQKPDICAPAYFREFDGTAAPNRGTSAACAQVAGAIAALRTHPKANQFDPYALKKVLLKTAQRAKNAGWDSKLGYGIIDAGEAYDDMT